LVAQGFRHGEHGSARIRLAAPLVATSVAMAGFLLIFYAGKTNLKH
jgi:hypothetical protein